MPPHPAIPCCERPSKALSRPRHCRRGPQHSSRSWPDSGHAPLWLPEGCTCLARGQERVVGRPVCRLVRSQVVLSAGRGEGGRVKSVGLVSPKKLLHCAGRGSHRPSGGRPLQVGPGQGFCRFRSPLTILPRNEGQRLDGSGHIILRLRLHTREFRRRAGGPEGNEGK